MASDRLDEVVRKLEEAETGYHQKFAQDAERRYRSYRGLVDTSKKKTVAWTSKLHPPYIFQIVETIVANMVEDRQTFAIRPRPRAADSQELQQRLLAARGLEALLRYQMDMDHFEEKQRPFAMQASITGLTVGKNYWRYGAENVKRRQKTTEEIAPGIHVPQLKVVEGVEVVHDDPTFEVVDVRDFMWHQAATSLDRALWVAHRVWMSYDELMEMQRRGLYKNVDDLRDTKDMSMVLQNRENDLFQRDRTKDMIEVIEFWSLDRRVVTVANRRVVLADRENPFWHGGYPFVACSTAPDLFQIPGISDVEIVEELQEMLWTVMNQRLDNLLLINNAIVMLASDVDDPDDFEFAPGAQWIVDRPDQVTMWTPNPMPAQVSIEAENLIKGDLQNITGGMPFASGADSGTVDQKTATGVSIITTLAQRRLAAKKTNFANAFERVAHQQIALLQQFMDEPRMVRIIGQDAVASFLEVTPEEIQGRFDIEVEATSESVMRQERRAEGQGLVQIAAQIAPVAAAVGTPINLKAFIEDWLRSFDKDDTERYFTAQPQMPAGAAAGGAPAGAPAGGPAAPSPGGPPNGVTAPQSIDPATSPSNQVSLSGSQFLQRALAMTGGANNQGG